MTSTFWTVVELDPDRVAVIDDGESRTTTFGHLAGEINALTHGWRALGLRRGDAVAVAVPNCREFLTCHLAAMQSGLYFVPINRHLASGEVAYIVTDSEAKAFVTHASVGAVAIEAADGAGLPSGRRFVVGGQLEGFVPFGALVAGQPNDRPAARPAGQIMMYSSGTTGRPKGVRRPLPDDDPDRLAGFVAEVTCAGFDIPADSVHLVCGPLYHAGPFLGAVNGIHTGNTIVMMDRWDAEACLALIERHRVTSTQMVPTMFHRLLALPDDVRNRYDVSSLKSVLHTGATCPVDVKRRMMEWWGPVLYETYGGTEAAATIAKPKRWLDRPGTVGKAIHGVTIKILDDDGAECPVGTPGDIYIANDRTPPPEYFKDPQKTASIQRDGFVTLGDVGYLDEDGYLFLCDRKIDMIVSGGVNIYPAEVEAALLTHPSVGDVAVVGMPDDEWGEAVLAVVEPAPGIDPSDGLAEELLAHCRTSIARFKCPRAIEFRPLPRLPNGKLLKRRLRDDLLARGDAPAEA